MKVYMITSEVATAPLGEIRTNGPGSKIDWIVDNTNGALPAEAKGSYDRLVQIVSKSSHLRLVVPKKATANLVRYVMDNGDVVEITTDGMTCMLNGDMLDDQQKASLFNAIRTGELKVARKADQPIPAIASPAQEKIPNVEKPKTDSSIIHLLAIMHEQDRQLEEHYSKHYDADIENGDYSDSDIPEFSKNLGYALKHGRGQDA